MKHIKHKKHLPLWHSGTYEYTAYFEFQGKPVVHDSFVYPCTLNYHGVSNCCHADCRYALIQETKGKPLADRLRLNGAIRGEFTNWFRFARDNPRGHPKRIGLAKHIRAMRARQDKPELQAGDYVTGLMIDVLA